MGAETKGRNGSGAAGALQGADSPAPAASEPPALGEGGRLTVADDDLIVPHPRMHERNFVMVPLLDLDPTIEAPGYDPGTAIGAVVRIGPL